MTNEVEAGAPGAAADIPPAQEFSIRKIYLKDVSFESPKSPEAFMGEWKPETDMNFQSKARTLAEGVYEVELAVTLTTRNNGEAAYLVELKQAGIFGVNGFSDGQLAHLFGAHCPSILLPFVREAISELVTKGGFPPFLLAPINFDALYAQHLMKQQAEAGQGGETQDA